MARRWHNRPLLMSQDSTRNGEIKDSRPPFRSLRYLLVGFIHSEMFTLGFPITDYFSFRRCPRNYVLVRGRFIRLSKFGTQCP